MAVDSQTGMKSESRKNEETQEKKEYRGKRGEKSCLRVS